MLFIDTMTLAPSKTRATSSRGGVSKKVQNKRIRKQLHQIEIVLKEAYQARYDSFNIDKDAKNGRTSNIIDSTKAPTWLLVHGHFPIYGVGPHGDTSELISYLKVFK